MRDDHPRPGSDQPIAAAEGTRDDQRTGDRPQLRLVAELAEQVQRPRDRAVFDPREQLTCRSVEVEEPFSGGVKRVLDVHCR